jgi:hypothetical protein
VLHRIDGGAGSFGGKGAGIARCLCPLPALYEAGIVIADLKRAAAGIYDFYNGYDPLFTWWMPRTYKELDSALTLYAAAFKERNKRFAPRDESGIVGHPVGREELLRELKYEMIPYTPEELIDIANKEFAWCDREMLKASHDMGFGDNWKAALEKVKNAYVPPGQQPDGRRRPSYEYAGQ